GVGSVDLLVERKSRDVIELRVPAQKAAFRLSNEAALKGLVTYDPGSRLFSVVNEPLPDPEKLTLLRCRVNIEVAGEKPTPAGLQSPTQKFTGTAKNGRIEGVFQLTPYRYAGKAAPAMASAPPSEPGLVRYLKREPNIESDDPEIKALAKQLTAGCATTWDGVVKIGAWVKQNITYEITGSGARECLRTRKGDCGPHSWLTIALCRAAGIPARITGGVLYSRMLGGSFGQHYWTRVWMGPDGWVPIDTTTGEVGTLSPAHITLWNLAGIAKLDVKVLAYEPRAAQTDTQPVVARKEYRPTRGQSERWVFVSDGKEVATQTAECVTVLDDAGRAFSDWRFEFTMPSASTTIKGTFSLWSDATPRKLAFDVAAGGTAQSGTYAFSRDAVEIALKVGEMPVARKHALKPGEMLQMNNLLTAFSLATRSLVLKPGETRTVPFFAASTMQSLDITFTVAAEARPVTVATGTRPCLVCDVEPIKNRFYLDVETGELVRVEAPKLVIERR
ncbi:MAG: transglutaminase domain-containing protein, partial [Armatimonadetes bacterium]|nr:transglutaminase domain-containing protein [Armatimonadota bacterium]